VRKHREYGGSLRRVRCQADGLAYASTLGWMQVEPQQRNAHPSEEEQSGSMNLPTSVAERINPSCPLTCLVLLGFPSLIRLRWLSLVVKGRLTEHPPGVAGHIL
jgi:hypothetical protein